MWRALVFLGLICLAAYGAVWLANNPETIAITWAGREYSTSLAVGLVGLVAVAILLSLILGGVRALVRLPSTIGQRSRRRRVSKGHSALSRGIVAVAAGDVAAARRYAGDAQRLLGQEPLALLLKAQAAQASGNREAADAAFREMTEKPETRVLGLRGLYMEARRRGDGAAAREHAEEAARIAPAIGWANDAVLEALSAEGDWQGAVRLIERRTSLGLVDKATSRRQRAVLLTADALGRETSDPDGALGAAERAVKLAPDLVPAAALAARLLSGKGDLKRAARVVETAWAALPHPELAAAYLNLRPGDSAIDRMRRAETLARLSSWSAESRFAIARAAIEARDLPRARDVLRPLLQDGERPPVRFCLMMAEIESRSGNAGATREWLARAARAPRDKAWVADGIASETWAPISPVTGRLDAFVWDTPPEVLGSSGEAPALSFEPEVPEDGGDELPAFLGRDMTPSLPASSPSGEPVSSADPVPASPDGPNPAPPSGAPSGTDGPVSDPGRELRPEPTATEGLARQPDSSPAAAPVAPTPAAVAPPRTPVTTPADISTSGFPDPSLPAEAAKTGAPSASDPSRPAGSSGSPVGRTRPPAEPEPVIFPVPRPPDDPGLEGETDRRQRFRLRV